MAQVRLVPTHTLIFQPPAAAPTPGEALWRRYRRAFTTHAARTDRRTAMRRAAAETITQHLVNEHRLGRPSNPAASPAGPEQPWRIEPLLRLYHRLS